MLHVFKVFSKLQGTNQLVSRKSSLFTGLVYGGTGNLEHHWFPLIVELQRVDEILQRQHCTNQPNEPVVDQVLTKLFRLSNVEIWDVVKEPLGNSQPRQHVAVGTQNRYLVVVDLNTTQDIKQETLNGDVVVLRVAELINAVLQIVRSCRFTQVLRSDILLSGKLQVLELFL